MAQIERDIFEKVEQTFSPGDAPKALALLSAAGKSERIARCIVFAARGSLERLAECIHLADQDYRDVIVAGEYDDIQRRLRDFSVSFLIDAPLKMWVSEVAISLAQRGYVLTSIEAVPADNGSTIYLGALGEGTATFEGEFGTISVSKRRGLWTINSDDAELQRYGLTKPFSNDKDLGDAFSGYILARRNPRGTVPITHS